MQMRFDGCIGFPGGLIDENDESIEDELNRELKEEINLDQKYFIKRENFVNATVTKSTNFKHFLYEKEVSYDEFIQIELDCLKSRDWGDEVIGILRPPFNTKPKTNDQNRGFGNFIRNKFISNGLLELIAFALNSKAMSFDEIVKLL